jgi:hypothetical protein
LPQVLGASVGPILRLGTGALAAGYKASWVADDPSSSGSYTLARAGGRRLVETSKVRCVYVLRCCALALHQHAASGRA